VTPGDCTNHSSNRHDGVEAGSIDASITLGETNDDSKNFLNFFRMEISLSPNASPKNAGPREFQIFLGSQPNFEFDSWKSTAKVADPAKVKPMKLAGKIAAVNYNYGFRCLHVWLKAFSRFHFTVEL